MTRLRFHPDSDGGGGGGAFTGDLDVGPSSVEGDILGGRPTMPDRQPPSTRQAAAAEPGYQPPPEQPADDRPSGRSTLSLALSQTFRRWGARLGLVWVLVLLFFAVFAPFLANSRPLRVTLRDGSWTSPLWNGLTGVDLALPPLLLGTVLLLAVARLRRLPPAVTAAAFVALVAVTFVGGFLVASPPLLERLGQYRQAEARGEYAGVVRAPIPFSPDDPLRDLGNPRTIPPWWSAPVKRGLHGLAPSWFGPVSAETSDALARVPTGHWLGTTVNGEDMASRMIHASRIALAIGFVATGIATLLGVAVGAVMGYFGGVVDLTAMRFIEVVQAIPVLVVLLLVMTSFGKNIWLMMTTIGLFGWTTDARFVRAEFLKLRGQDFVQAARAAGLGTRSILFRHMLPNGVAPVLVNASFGVATAILLESFLSFLGLGLEAKDPSWGQLLNQARSGGTGFNWWIATFPGLAIFLTVFAYILIGESLRDAIDPKLKKSE